MDGSPARPPPNSYNPDFASAAGRRFRWFASSLQGAPQASGRQGGRRSSSSSSSSSVGSATSSFFRYIGFCRFQLVGKHPALWLVLGCIFDVPGLVVTATSKWLDRSGSGRCGREEASSVEEPRSKFLANLDCFGDPSRIVHFRDLCMWRFSLVGAEASGRRGNPHSNCRLDCFGSPSTTHCGRSCIFFRSPQL